MVQQQNKNLHLIQVLRGVASLLVVLRHVTANSILVFKQDFFFNFFSFGGSGVDIFFVLSGFIITYTSIAGISQVSNLLPFIRKRIVRIFPTYWITITLFLAIQAALPSFYKTHFNFHFSNLLSTYLLFPGHFMVNGVSWTLTYELFFYFLFSFAFIIPNKKLAFYLGIIYSILIILVPLSGYTAYNKNVWISLLYFPMNVEFFMGVSIALFISKISARLSVPLIIIGSLLFLAAGIASNNGYQFLPNVFNRVLFFGIPAFLIITGIVKLELSKKIAVHNILLTLGGASYSLYLIHLPLVAAFVRIIAKFNVHNNIVIHILLLIMVVAICCVSILFYKAIEQPVINRLNTLAKNKVFVSKGGFKYHL